MGFPIKDVVARVFLDEHYAYLIVGKDVLTVSKNGLEPNKYISSKAKQVEFFDLPEEAQDVFVDNLTSMNIPLNARGLFKLPELVKVEERDMYVIMQKRTRMRHNNYRIYLGEQEVHKAETLKAARQWIDANLESD